MSADPTPAPGREGAAPASQFPTTLLVIVLGAVAALAAFTFGLSRQVGEMRASVDNLATAQKAAAQASAASQAAQSAAHQAAARAWGEGMAALDGKVDRMLGDVDILANDMQRIERKVDDLTKQLENRGEVQSDPPQPPQLDWTEPDLFEVARNGADSVGITLTKDEVRCPSRLVLKQGLLEYLVVLKGGKEHETLFTIVGNTAPDERRAKDMGVKLNNALQAIGFRRGTPIRFGPTGTAPASGETVHLFVEWTTKGVKEICRAEDLVWHSRLSRPMKPGTLVYVGSRFVQSDQAGDPLLYAADLTAEAVATYSAPSTMIDNVDEGAQDDTVFIVASPRIPDDVLECTLIFRKTELPGVKVFPPVPKDEDGTEDEEGTKSGDGK